MLIKLYVIVWFVCCALWHCDSGSCSSGDWVSAIVRSPFGCSDRHGAWQRYSAAGQLLLLLCSMFYVTLGACQVSLWLSFWHHHCDQY